MGDGALMELARAIAAVAFSVEVRATMRKRSSEVPEDRGIVYRVCIGDITAGEGKLHGNRISLTERLLRCFAWVPQVIESAAYTRRQPAAGYREFH